MGGERSLMGIFQVLIFRWSIVWVGHGQWSTRSYAQQDTTQPNTTQHTHVITVGMSRGVVLSTPLPFPQWRLFEWPVSPLNLTVLLMPTVWLAVKTHTWREKNYFLISLCRMKVILSTLQSNSENEDSTPICIITGAFSVVHFCSFLMSLTLSRGGWF